MPNFNSSIETTSHFADSSGQQIGYAGSRVEHNGNERVVERIFLDRSTDTVFVSFAGSSTARIKANTVRIIESKPVHGARDKARRGQYLQRMKAANEAKEKAAQLPIITKEI